MSQHKGSNKASEVFGNNEQNHNEIKLRDYIG
jgi:hypothetical protein